MYMCVYKHTNDNPLLRLSSVDFVVGTLNGKSVVRAITTLQRLDCLSERWACRRPDEKQLLLEQRKVQSVVVLLAIKWDL